MEGRVFLKEDKGGLFRCGEELEGLQRRLNVCGSDGLKVY